MSSQQMKNNKIATTNVEEKEATAPEESFALEETKQTSPKLLKIETSDEDFSKLQFRPYDDSSSRVIKLTG